MSEPTTTTIATAATGIGLAALFPAVDGNALIGSVAGALLFFISSREPNLVSRVGYAVVSLLMGYLMAPELVQRKLLAEMAVAAFLSSATVVTLTLTIIERIKTMDLSNLFRRP